MAGFGSRLGQSQVRLLSLHSGKLGDPIHCSLEVIDLHSNKSALSTSKAYSALSYTWGLAEQHCSIRLNNLSNFPVTDNLFAALQRLRSPEHTRMLWIDAVCINQQDVAERSSQVALMASVYRQAASVLIWLGDADEPESGRVVSLMKHRQHRMSVESHQWKLRTIQRLVENGLPLWWTRTWVLQEFAMARELPNVLFGQFQVSWAEFEDLAMDLLNGEHLGWAEQVCNPVRNMSRVRNLVDSRLTILVLAAINTNATLPIDKLYSLLGMADESESRLIELDYTQSTAASFAKATYASIEASSNLEILKVVSLVDRGEFELPSWSVNFASISLAPGRDIGFMLEYLSKPDQIHNWFSTCITYASNTYSADEKHLRLSGVSFDKVVATASMPAPYDRTSIDAVLPEITKLIDMIDCSSPYRRIRQRYSIVLDDSSHIASASPYAQKLIDKGKLGTAIEWRAEVLTDASRPSGWDPKGLFRTLCIRWSQAIQNIVNYRDIETRHQIILSDLSRYESYTQVVGSYFDIFVTELGFLGAAPVGVMSGDIVALLHGSKEPAILRPQDAQQAGFFTFHGLGYVHGIMNGELRSSWLGSEVEEMVFNLI